MLGLDEAEACFGGWISGEACRRMVPAKCYAVHSGEFTDSPRQGRLTPCQDEGMSSRTTRGYWKLGAIGCGGASWSKEHDDKEPHGAPRSVRASENFRVLDTIAYSCFFYLLHSGVCLFQKIE